MNKSSNPSSLKNIDLGEENLRYHSTIEWLSSHKHIFLWSFVALLALLILAYRFASIRTSNAETDFFQAQHAFSQFQQESTSSGQENSTSSDLQQLIAIMQRHPELKPKYEGSLAQTLLANGQVAQAQIFAEDIFKRTQPDHLQFYQDYSKASFLIGEGHYSEALQQSQHLQSALDRLSEGTYPVLYVFNLIRLAMLYQETGQPQAELETWKQLQNQPQRLEAVMAAYQLFKVGQASLDQYIDERKKALIP